MKIRLLLAGSLFLAACSGVKPSPTPAWYKVDPATAGTLTGKALFTGTKPPRKTVEMDQEPICARLHPTALVEEPVAATATGGKQRLANVFVYVKQGLEDKKFEPPADPAVIDQNGCWFAPRVLGVQVGQTLKVTNSDPLTHNIHPMPHNNRDWNQSQAPGADPLLRKFSQPEIMVRVKCNIHGWMHAWVGVVAHPYFAVTGADGSFQLRNLPPGVYTIEAWQEQLGTLQQPVTIAPSGKSDLVFTFKGE